jgi:hypothetical protein
MRAGLRGRRGLPMSVDRSELKRIISRIKSGKLPAVPGGPEVGIPALSSKRRAAARMVESVVQKAGLDEGRFSKLVAEDQRALRLAFDKRRAAAAGHARASSAAFHSAMAARAQALNVLRAPFLAATVNLDKPFLIWQLPNPQLNIFIDSQIASMNSFVRVLVNTDRDSNVTRFVFYFFWPNDTDAFAVINLSSLLVVNGACSAQAKSGIFSGDVATLSADASMAIFRWSGWGKDPATGQSNDQTLHPDFQPTQRQNIAFLRAEGGHIFEGADFKSKALAFEQFPLSHRMLIVPNRASVLLQISLELNYGFDGGDDIQDNIFVDFSERGSAVFCPNVEVEVLTALSGLSAKQAQGFSLASSGG